VGIRMGLQMVIILKPFETKCDRQIASLFLNLKNIAFQKKKSFGG